MFKLLKVVLAVLVLGALAGAGYKIWEERSRVQADFSQPVEKFCEEDEPSVFCESLKNRDQITDQKFSSEQENNSIPNATIPEEQSKLIQKSSVSDETENEVIVEGVRKKRSVNAGKNRTVCCSGPKKIVLGSGAPIPGVRYSWWPTTGLNNPNILRPTLDMGVFDDPDTPFSGIYSVTATYPDGRREVDRVNISTVCGCRPPAMITKKVKSYCDNVQTLTAKCGCDCSSDLPLSYEWNSGGTTASIDVQTTERQGFRVKCTNACGSTWSPHITVDPLPSLTGNFSSTICANVFTPNGDGVNDLHQCYNPNRPIGQANGYNATGYQMEIRNRWGRVVFKASGSSPTGFPNGTIPGWNGIANRSTSCTFWQWVSGCRPSSSGREASDGVYFYIFKMQNCSTPLRTVRTGYVHKFG